MSTTERLTPVLRDRLRQLLGGRSWPRGLSPRRLIAAALVLFAGVLAVRPDPARTPPPTVPLLVAARDLAPGSTLGPADVRVERAPPDLRPASALDSAQAVSGRVLAGAAGAGEPITATRLVGRENTRLTTGGADAVAVPVRLADPAVADLLVPGARVDVVAAEGHGAPGGSVLATDVIVVTVLKDDAADGRLVVIAMPREVAPRVAAAALGYPVAVTLR